VYGDTPNRLPLIELDNRYEIDLSHRYAKGIDESMSIDNSKHSLFGVSKLAADVMAQEYGKYFGIKTGIFRGGCLTGINHAGAEQHGFLSYLINCAVNKKPYTIFGYKGKQVRDNIDVSDIVTAFWEFFKHPRAGEVYNLGGGRMSNCSILEAIDMIGLDFNYTVVDEPRSGDHQWYISDMGKFREHYPGWEQQLTINDIICKITASAESKR
jgi:CDP-paratose 2-epimerase